MKKLWLIFGPVVVATILIVAVFFTPWQLDISSEHFVKDAAVSMDVSILKGTQVKQAAIDQNYLPFFGSSELSRISPFHPAVLAQQYQRDYRVLLLGAPGTQSLTQALGMEGLTLDRKKAVVIISPQWFVKEGLKSDSFAYYYSPLQVTHWLRNLKEISAADHFMAQRLLSYPVVQQDHRLVEALQNVVDYKQPEKWFWQLESNFYAHEDEFFSFILGTDFNQKKIQKQKSYLPKVDDPAVLDELAYEMGQKNTDNNAFEISNGFYQKRILPDLSQLKDSQKDFDYRCSPEFSDFELLLRQFAQQHADILFVIPPVNQHWSDYTGLSQEMLGEFSHKIQYQLNAQGFNKILDLNQFANTDYFMEDTIHLGWRGWLQVDSAVQQFMNDKNPVLNYQLDDYFYQESWQNLAPNRM
ncbi:D-alanyl-lipoteichoic acid biosynthesis protein DltD [Enterococcus timonensis]|uniref:D-alanyl-lipoteichoic acid biosynthesis protein DltD n=1 Tax=Enterococcus timonensis TaxID=1852364 RepID=UPI0008D91304|nr:D-alanyl-lipoteichoic acid biosynthesis protein DltD [Enterococcus timonensis]